MHDILHLRRICFETRIRASKNDLRNEKRGKNSEKMIEMGDNWFGECINEVMHGQQKDALPVRRILQYVAVQLICNVKRFLPNTHE